LDKEIILQQFEKIEKKVERIVSVCNAYKTKNEELSNKIEQLEEELLGRVVAEKAYNEEKTLIKTKIDGLLIKLEDMAAEKQ